MHLKKDKKFLFECAYCCLEFRSYQDPKMKSLKAVGNWFNFIEWLGLRYRIMVWEGEEEMVFEGKVKISYWEGNMRDQSWEQRESAVMPGFWNGVSSSFSAVRLGGKVCLLFLSRDLIPESEWLRLEGGSSGDPVQPPAPAETPRVTCSDPCPRDFRVSSRVNTLHPLWRNPC